MSMLDVFGWRQSWCSDRSPERRPDISGRLPPRQRARLALTMLSGSAATPCLTWGEPRRASQKTGAALVRCAGQPSPVAIIAATIAPDGARAMLAPAADASDVDRRPSLDPAG